MTVLMQIKVDGESLTTAALYNFSKQAESPTSKFEVSMSPEGLKRLKASENFVKDVVKNDKAVYGINTGFGRFAEVRVSNSELEELQENIYKEIVGRIKEKIRRQNIKSRY
jgi:histidine ammonia-lyase